jgi:hypothetical protein
MSIVVDQFVFDAYLNQEKISLHQHRAAEYLLYLAAISNMWAKGLPIDRIYYGGEIKNNVPFHVIPFGAAINKIENNCGKESAIVTLKIIIHNREVELNLINLFKRAMDYISDEVMLHHKNPLKHLL